MHARTRTHAPVRSYELAHGRPLPRSAPSPHSSWTAGDEERGWLGLGVGLRLGERAGLLPVYHSVHACMVVSAETFLYVFRGTRASYVQTRMNASTPSDSTLQYELWYNLMTLMPLT